MPGRLEAAHRRSCRAGMGGALGPPALAARLPSVANRTSGRNGSSVLYSRSRGRDQGRSACPVRARRQGLVRGDIRGADAGPVRGLGGHRRGPAHADPRPDRQRQDPRRVPVVPRPACPGPTPGTDQGATRHRPCPLRQPAEGADLRRRAQPSRPPRRHRPRSRPPRRTATQHLGRLAHGRHARRRAPRPRSPPAGHPRHDPREPVPPADQPGARDPQGRRARDRRRGPRDRGHQARRPPGPEPRTPRAPAGHGATRTATARRDASSASASAPPSGPSRPSPGTSAASARAARSASWTPARRKPLELQVVVPVEDMARLGEVLPMDEQPGGPVSAASCGRASGRRSTRGSWS